ncbi:TPA: zinc-ribbon domain-containing protein [archaeon]|uniref:Zinc-ribbon domain-containing protein n=1 Tax=Candidatus Naiadarchaeum limnaeum TaxID=2756139 RepID=A0A832XM14_9ARCH|nr:zinc-ribbon domain-containing protein [Candidatus Naiadarchaeum limnaeum]
MSQVFQGLKKKFESKHKKCPSCGAKISKTARICPECGQNFIFHVPEPKSWQFSLNTENCCSIFLILLIAIALLYLIFPLFKTIFLIIGVAVVVIILIILVIFAKLVYRIKKMFNF